MRRSRRVVVALLLAVALASSSQSFAASLQGFAHRAAPQLSRGPYLQLATPTSIVVRWKTSEPTDSQVTYGTDLTDLSEVKGDASLTNEHEIELTGLLPATTYFYTVGTTTSVLAGGDSTTFFRTPPVVGRTTATRIWVVGDSGTANANSRSVFDAYDTFAAGDLTHFWLMLGDNAYPSGTEARYQAAVFETYPELLRRSPLWPAFGNHDAESASATTQSGPYFDLFTLPTSGEAGGFPSATEAYYSFAYANIHIIVLDSHESDRSPGSPMLTWLANDLAATSAEWILAIWHHPPYSKGSHNSDTELRLIEMRENVLPLLEAGGVDLVLTGHSHAYERSMLIDSHYGDSASFSPSMILDPGLGDPLLGEPYRKLPSPPMPHQGTVYVVAGNGGRLSGGSFDHPTTIVAHQILGSMVLDITGHVLDALFLTNMGTVEDRFRILKDEPLFADGFETANTSAWSSSF